MSAYAVPADPANDAHTANTDRILKNIKATNLADEMTDEALASLGSKAVEEYEIDLESRKAAGWETINTAAMKLALQVKESKSYPWPGAANVKYPLLITAAIQFNARAYPAIIDGANVVKGKVLGKHTDEKQDRADRIGRHMSYQLLDEMDGWEEDTDRLLVMLPVTGCVFRKTWFDTVRDRNASRLVPPDRLVVNYWTRDLDSCPRVTQLESYYPNEIEERIRAGLWRRVELGRPQDSANDDMAPHDFLEQHRLWDLDGDGYAEPYIVTVHHETSQVVRVVARYDEDGVKINARGEVQCIEGVRYFTKYGFIPSPDGAFYDIGFGWLLNALNETINSTLNQLLDAGHLANTQGGFIGSGISIKSGTLRFVPGEWKKAETDGTSLKDNIVPLPVAEPSAVLFNLLGLLIDAAKDITATKDILTGDETAANTPVGTTLARIEQGLKVFTAIYKRVHRALAQEYAALYRLNRLYLDPQSYFTFQDEAGAIAQKDYAAGDVDVVPVSDPTAVSDMQRITRAEFLMQFRADPLMDGKEINKRVLEAASVPDVKQLFATNQAPDPAMMEAMAKKDESDRKHALDDRKLTLEEKRFALEEAQALAANTDLYANAIATLAGAGQTTSATAGPDGTKSTKTVNEGVPEHAETAMAGIHRLAVAEIDAALTNAETQQAPEAQNVEQPQPGQVQPGDVSGVASPSPDAAPASVLQGPADGTGAPVGDGTGDVGAPAGESLPDGGVLGPQVG